MPDDRDRRLAEVLDDLLLRTMRGEPVDADAIFREHAELLPELRELWATVMVAEDCASVASDDASLPTLLPERSPGRHAIADSPPDELGDYELLEELGRGGMGVVYKARQKSLDRVVALKMILQGDFASETDLQRFRAEAESTARLNHPHIVPLYEVGNVDHRPFFSMRYVEGRTLSQRLIDGPLPPREAAELLLPICRAVAEAHRHGIVHRDLKPSNILIDRDGVPYVTDFGLAKRFVTEVRDRRPEVGDQTSEQASIRNLQSAILNPSLTGTGAILGTPGYMAPEQAAGQRGSVTAATDVYSLGALLYAMLTGRAPFQAASPVDTVLMVLEQDPLPPRLLNRAIDPDLEMIALKCLQKPKDLRYASADALAADLQAYLAGESISARSGRFLQVVSRAFRETHHAAILENWGLLWMWHSLVLIVLCLVTNAFQWNGVTSRLPYVALWGVGLGVWAAFFWNLRQRAGPITFVERQIAHVWAGSVAASVLLFFVEAILDRPVLSFSPVLGIVAGMVFLAKAGILTGRFYFEAGYLFATGLVMAWLQQYSVAHDIPDFGISLFGVVSGASFFFPGLKYYRQRSR